MSADELKPGIVVMLKSGGPPMTVEGLLVDEDGEKVEVVWFTQGNLQRAEFLQSCLTVSQEKKSILDLV